MNKQYKKPTIKIVKFKCKCLQVPGGGSDGGYGHNDSRQYRSTWDDKE